MATARWLYDLYQFEDLLHESMTPYIQYRTNLTDWISNWPTKPNGSIALMPDNRSQRI